MEIIFFGSSDISVPFLEELYKSRHSVNMVVTIVDRPAGRGRKVTDNVVKKKAEELRIEYVQIERFDDNFYRALKEKKFDAVIISSFGKILDKKIFEMTDARWLNIHPSLLPRYRGPAPIVSALINGDVIGGVSIVEVVPEVDAGRIYAQVKFRIGMDDNRESYEKKVIELGKSALLKVLDLMEYHNLEPYPQGSKGIIFTQKIKKEDLRINWENEREEIINKVRAFSPKPGAYCFWKNLRIKILKVSIPDETGKDLSLSELKVKKNINDGEVVRADKNSGILVRCRENKLLRIELLQPEGKRVMSAMDFINGYRLKAGEKLE